MPTVIRTRSAKRRKPFIKVGDKVVYLGSEISSEQGGRKLWRKSGDVATVTEFHDGGSVDALLLFDDGERVWDEAHDYAVVKFRNGLEIAIQADDRGRRWKVKKS